MVNRGLVQFRMSSLKVKVVLIVPGVVEIEKGSLSTPRFVER